MKPRMGLDRPKGIAWCLLACALVWVGFIYWVLK